MAGSNLGTVWVELSLDDKIYKQKLGETLTSSTATAKGIETAWRALGTKSDATFDQMRKSAENAYTLIATASGKASQETIRAQQAAADKIKSINEQQYGQQATWIEKTKANWLGLTLAVGAAMVAMNKAAEFVELGAKAQQAEDSFKRVAESSGESADKIITSMKRATVGTVDDSDLMQRAVKGMMLGLSGDAMVKIAEMARLGARVAGTSVADAIEGITNSIATGMPRALKQYGLALGPEVKIITAAQTAGVEGINLMTLAQMNFDIQLARHGEIQANAIEQTQIFKAQITELKEQLGGALIALLRQDYGLLQALGSGFLYAAGATNYLVAGLANVAAWTADKLGFDEKAKSMKAYADFATATAKQLIADADAMKNRGVANITGNAESSKTGTTSDAQAKIAQLEKDKAAFLKDVKDRTAAMKNAGKNEAKDAQNNLAGQLSDIKSHYDAAIALDTQWYERQKENGANSVDLDNQYYDKKNADLYSSYDQQWKLIEQSSVRESEKYKNLTALNKTYEDALGKNRIELTKSLIADEKTHIDVMAAAYKTIGDYSDTAQKYEIAKINETYKIKHASVKAGSQEEIDLEKAKQTEIFKLQNSSYQTLIDMELSYLETVKGPYSETYKAVFEESLKNQAAALELAMKNAGLEFDKEAWLTQKQNEELAKRLEARATYYMAIGGMEDKANSAALAAIEIRKQLNIKAYGDEVAADKTAAQSTIKSQQDIIDAMNTRFDTEHKYQKDSITNAVSVCDNAMSLMDKESKGYQIMQDAKKVLQIAELAMEIEKNIKILAFGVAQSTSAVAAAQVQNAANASTAVTGAVASVASAGIGIPPYSFANVAAMIAVMAGVLGMVGIAFGGASASSGATATASLPTSTVLGAENGTGSQSVENGYKLLQDTYDLENVKLTRIYDELKDLNSNITGLVRNYVSTGGVSSSDFTVSGDSTSKYADIYNSDWMSLAGVGSSFTNTVMGGYSGWATTGADVLGGLPGLSQITTWVSDFLGDAISSIFGGAQSSEVTQSGIAIGENVVGSIISGAQASAQSFGQVTTTTDGGWFNGDDTSVSNQYGTLDSSISDMLTKVFKGIGGTLVSLSTELGTNTQDALNYTFAAINIDLQGKTTDEINTALSDYINNIADTAVSTLFGSILTQYQSLGEGLYETAVRLVNDKLTILKALEMTGQSFHGTATAAIAMSENLISLAGDLSTLTDAMGVYYDKFTSDETKQSDLQTSLTSTLAKYHLSLGATRDSYTRLVDSLDLTTKRGQAAYVALMQLSGSADQYYTYLETAQAAATDAQAAAAQASADLATQQRSIEIQIMTAQGDAAGALAATRADELAAMDESLRPLQERLYALQDEATAITDLTTAVDGLNTRAQTIAQFITDMGMSDQAPVQSAAAWDTEYAKQRTLAMASGATDQQISDYLAFAKQYLSYEQSYGTTGSYQAIYDAIMKDVTSLGTSTNTALDIAQQQLDVLIQIRDGNGVQASYASGTDYVPETGLYKLHQGEIVTTKTNSVKALGAAIGEYIVNSNGGSNGGDIHVSVQIDGREIGNVVAKQTRTNPDLQKSIRNLN